MEIVRSAAKLFAIALLSACAATESAAPAPSSQGGRERLYHEMEVTLAGTRSQGVRGRLYDQQGRSIAVSAEGAVVPESDAPGGALPTHAGVFVQRPRVHLWDVSGMINEALLPPQRINTPSVTGPTLFRLYVRAECTRSEGWRGELLAQRGARPAPPSDAPIDTPMGRFTYRTSAHPWGQHGWFPESWPAPEPGPERWPCTRRS